MNRYRYRAARPDGGLVSGVLAAPDLVEVEGELQRDGLFPLAIEPAPAGVRWRRGADRRDLAVVFRSLASLVRGGVPLARALCATASLPRSPALRDTLHHARRYLAAGHSLTAALDRAGDGVPAVVLGMLRAGERGSQLDAALEQAALQLERDAELAGRIRQALAYPAILLVAGLASLGVITLVVVPRFAVLLAEVGQALPPATRLLLAIGTLLQAHGLLLVTLAAAGVAALAAWIGTPAGRRHWHRTLLGLPLIGPIRQGFATARITRAAGAMLETGVPILLALAAAGEAAGDAEVAARVARARASIESGAAVTAAFEAEQVITPAALQVLAVGDAGGRLGTMALRAGDLAAGEAEARLRLLVNLLEPSLVILFGGLVAFAAAALLQAVYSLRPG